MRPVRLEMRFSLFSPRGAPPPRVAVAYAPDLEVIVFCSVVGCTSYHQLKKKPSPAVLRMMALVKLFLHAGYDIRSCSTGMVVMPVTVTTTVTNELRRGRRVMFERYFVSRRS